MRKIDNSDLLLLFPQITSLEPLLYMITPDDLTVTLNVYRIN
jgi:hypothetical protein